MSKLDPTLEEMLKNYRELLDRVEKLEDSLKTQPPVKWPNESKSHCPICGLDLTGMTAYVCYNDRCPTFTRITC